MDVGNKISSIVLYGALLLLVNACGGGGGNSGSTQELSADQRAFSQTLYPQLREKCSSCHSDGGVAGADLAKFAHSNVVIAYDVVINRDLVNLSNPSLSVFVQRLSVDAHHCWSECQTDGDDIAQDIADWKILTDLSGVGSRSTDTSITAFEQTVYPLLRQYCASCHDGGLPFAAIASPDVEQAHSVTLDGGLVNLNVPVESRVSRILIDNNHNCWSDCATDGTTLQNAIVSWASQASANGGIPGDGNNAPVALDDSYTTTANVPLVTGNVFVNDTDPDNDTLAIGDFQARSNQGGTVVNNLSGTFSYTPPAGFVGSDWFNYTIVDGKGGSATARVNITVIRRNAPVASDDTVRTNQNTPVTIPGLVNNDSSSNGNPLSIVSVDRFTANGGTVDLALNNTVRYTPPTDFTGFDSFNYTVSDGSGVDSAKVTININGQPVAIGDSVYTYVDTTANTGNVLGNDFDENGDKLSIGGFDSASAQAGRVEYNGDGSFTYVPPDDFQGNDSFSYIVLDGRGGTATATVNIAVTEQILRDDNRFLRFLNQSSPLHQETTASARAYYRAVDPLDQRTTLEDWRNVNGFNLGADAFATYINNNDLGFSRRMFIRTDPITGIVSSYVENYANLQDALNQNNVIATVAMEYTVAPGQDPLDPNAQWYTTFYVFDGNDNRDLGADLDGRGFKFVPGLCNTCHGGRPKALVNGVYPEAGNTDGGFIPWDLDTYLFADNTASVSRSAQEIQFKILNQTVLRTNPLPANKEVVEGWYGGPGMPANTFNGSYVPSGWLPPAAPSTATQLYLQVVAPACRACHIMRGTSLQSDIDFASYDKFMSYKSRTERLVFDESTMPLALRTWDRFWGNNSIVPETLARFLNSSKILDDGELLSPGRPLANPGPFREAAIGIVELNGGGSLYTGGTSDFNWTLVQRPADSRALLQNADEPNPRFLADVPGDYVLQLVVNDGVANTPPSPPAEVVVRVSPAVRGMSFVSDVSPIFERCAVCHLGFDNPGFNNLPTLYRNVIDFVNLDDPLNSRILAKPAGKHHAGGVIGGFETPVSKGYQAVLRWILEGAPDN